MRAFRILCLAVVMLASAWTAARADDAAALRERALAMLRLAAPTVDPDTPPIAHRHACLDDLQAARAKATAESRPLLIWVGGCDSVDAAVRGAFPDAVHCHADTVNGSGEHRLLIPLREGVYAVFDSATLTKASVPTIGGVLARVGKSAPVAAPPVLAPQAILYRPVQAAPAGRASAANC